MARVTLATLLDGTMSKLDRNSLFYPQSEVSNAINEAIRLLNLFCGWINTTEGVPSDSVTVAGRIIYRVPDEIAIPEKVSFNGIELDKIGMDKLCHFFPDWMKETTASTGRDVTRWCPYAANRFILNPGDAVGGGLLEVTGIAVPNELVEDTDYVDIPRDGISAIAEYAAHIVQCKLGQVPLVQSMPMYRTYEQLVKQQKIWTSYKQPNFWLDLKTPE